MKITKMVFDSKDFIKQLDCYKIVRIESVDSIEINKDLLYMTSNVIILELIRRYRGDFLDKFQFDHAIDKVITYTNHSSLLSLEIVFLKLYEEVVKPYLKIDYQFVGVYTSD